MGNKGSLIKIKATNHRYMYAYSICRWKSRTFCQVLRQVCSRQLRNRIAETKLYRNGSTSKLLPGNRWMKEGSSDGLPTNVNDIIIISCASPHTRVARSTVLVNRYAGVKELAMTRK